MLRIASLRARSSLLTCRIAGTKEKKSNTKWASTVVGSAVVASGVIQQESQCDGGTSGGLGGVVSEMEKGMLATVIRGNCVLAAWATIGMAQTWIQNSRPCRLHRGLLAYRVLG